MFLWMLSGLTGGEILGLIGCTVANAVSSVLPVDVEKWRLGALEAAEAMSALFV